MMWSEVAWIETFPFLNLKCWKTTIKTIVRIVVAAKTTKKAKVARRRHTVVEGREERGWRVLVGWLFCPLWQMDNLTFTLAPKEKLVIK
jgi:hypothetical protein